MLSIVIYVFSIITYNLLNDISKLICLKLQLIFSKELQRKVLKQQLENPIKKEKEKEREKEK